MPVADCSAMLWIRHLNKSKKHVWKCFMVKILHESILKLLFAK